MGQTSLNNVYTSICRFLTAAPQFYHSDDYITVAWMMKLHCLYNRQQDELRSSEIKCFQPQDLSNMIALEFNATWVTFGK